MDKDINAPATVQDFKELAEFVGEKFERVDKKFDQIDKRFDKIDLRLDKLDNKFDIALTGINKILQFSEKQKDENIVGAAQIRRHTDTLNDHEKRIAALELQPQE